VGHTFVHDLSVLSFVSIKCIAPWARRLGLAPPAAVVDATKNYLTDEDAIGRFIAERCERHPQAHEELKKLYAAWKEFAAAAGETVVSEKSFSQKLEGQNLVKAKGSRSRRICFRGIKLRLKEDEAEFLIKAPQ
jgi:putative DNA primase/helicase